MVSALMMQCVADPLQSGNLASEGERFQETFAVLQFHLLPIWQTLAQMLMPGLIGAD
jgi:hypothetical protein